MFGDGLGTGDYGHLTIEHAPMLLRRNGSLKEFSNQGFEASHTSQRQLYSRATDHDAAFSGSSGKIHNHELSLYTILCNNVTAQFVTYIISSLYTEEKV